MLYVCIIRSLSPDSYAFWFFVHRGACVSSVCVLSWLKTCPALPFSAGNWGPLNSALGLFNQSEHSITDHTPDGSANGTSGLFLLHRGRRGVIKHSSQSRGREEKGVGRRRMSHEEQSHHRGSPLSACTSIIFNLSGVSSLAH